MQEPGYSKRKGLRSHFWPNKATAKAAQASLGLKRRRPATQHTDAAAFSDTLLGHRKG